MSYRDFFTGLGIAVSLFALLALACIAVSTVLYEITVLMGTTTGG